MNRKILCRQKERMKIRRIVEKIERVRRAIMYFIWRKRAKEEEREDREDRGVSRKRRRGDRQ